MIIGIGVDLVKISRVQTLMRRWESRFLDRVFTPSEQAYSFQYRSPHIRLSARFAVKEAVLKALGIGLQMGVRWKEIETVNNPFGKPEVRLSGRTGQIAQQQHVSRILASITHENDYSFAQVILTSREWLWSQGDHSHSPSEEERKP